jgi:hypothetical protein
MRRLALLLLLALAAGCGPRPSVESFTPRPGETFVVDAIVKNEGGEGQVEVKLTLTDPAKNEVVARDTKDIDMRADERQHVVLQVDLPKSAKVEPGKLAVAVEASYPIE